jgi:D-3-phosphoglycerate dehydrogenase
MHIYVTEPKEIEAEALEMLTRAGHTVRTEASHAAEVLFVRTYTQVTSEYLDTFPNVKYVLRAGVGLDNVDVAECKKRGIQVINAPGANSNAVAEYVVATAVSAIRHFAEQRRSLEAGSWRSPEFVGQELKNKVLGLVGCGNVGKMIAHKLSTWELKEIIGYDPFLTAEQLATAGIRKVELNEVITTADVISLHVPLIPETKHLINADSLARMKRGALLINAARGGVVDEAALVDALKAGALVGAVLDVFETEPEVSNELKKLPNVILTPHIGGYTDEANKEVSLAPVRELLRRV